MEIRKAKPPDKDMRVHVLYYLLVALVIITSCEMTDTYLTRDNFTAHAQNEPCPGCSSGIITKIIDGDTLDVDGVRIRLALVDTPERGDPGYEGATAFAASLCKIGDTAFYDPDDGQPDGSYGRIIAEVFCSGKSLNAELVQDSHARILYNFCNVSEFAVRPWAGCSILDTIPEQTHTEPSELIPDPIPEQTESYVILVLVVTGLAIFIMWRRSRKPNVCSKPGHL
ncbi:MAG: thermonuclease family protein [Nitrosopumilus sp. B06]|nr:MAG: thermonuclease family protein [Nitrosopumilus sp. B06]